MKHLLLYAIFGGCVACSTSKSAEQDKPDSGLPKVILDGGGTLPDAPNGVAQCQKGACNYQDQDCSGAMNCLPSSNPGSATPWPPACQVGGTRGDGESCTAWTDCKVGYFCTGFSSSQTGICRKLCCGGDWSACSKGQSCIRQLYLKRPGSGSSVEYAGADVCAPVGTCDVLDPNACKDEPGRSCQIVDPLGNVACAPEGSLDVGSNCSGKDGCKRGLSCVGNRCTRLCKAVEGGGDPECRPGEGVCVHFKRNPPGVGECTQLEF